MTDSPTVAVIAISGVILIGRVGTEKERERERERQIETEIDNDIYVHTCLCTYVFMTSGVETVSHAGHCLINLVNVR